MRRVERTLAVGLPLPVIPDNKLIMSGGAASI
jgi:hypothetical protein